MNTTFLFYKRFISSQAFVPPITATWSIEGNGSFNAADIGIVNGFPIINKTYTVVTISKSAGYTFNCSNVVSNYDSVAVQISGSGFSLTKSAGISATSLSFSPAELSPISGNNGYVIIYGFNCFHKTINNKKYVFELSNSFLTQVNITP